MTETTFFADLMTNFHFLRPLWLLALIPALLLVFYLWHVNEKASAWDRAIDKDLLPFLLDTSKTVAERTPLVLLFLLWTLAITALAGPVWQKISQPVQERQDALVIVYDQSLSMYATDYDPNRLTVSKRKLLDILDRRIEGQTALIVYAGDAHAVTPLTEDSITIKALVPSITPNIMPSFGSNATAAIELAKNLLTDAGALTGTILMITDGIDRNEHPRIAGLLTQSGYRLAILGVGTEEGAPIPAADGDFLREASGQIIVPTLDKSALKTLAAQVNGLYADMELADNDFNYLLAEDSYLNDDEFSKVDENFDIWYEVGPWLLLLILPLSALIFRRGWILSLALTVTTLGVLTPAQNVEAAEWTDLWKTRDQQAAESFENGDPAAAAATFESPAWRGSAAYQAGDYDAAIQAYSSQPFDKADAHYNIGNAYAHIRSFEQAIAAYDAAIAMDPNHEDAIHNREIVQALLEEQQEQQKEEQESQESMEQEKQEEEESQDNEGDSEEEKEGEQQQEAGDKQEEQEPSEPQDGGEQQESDEQTEGEKPNMSNAETESQESLEQWLRRLDDDPGELLQRKFQFEYRRRQQENRSSNQPAETQIW